MFNLGMKFESGQCVATPALLDHATVLEYTTLLRRHLQGDWGADDKRLNEEALKDGSRIFSAYDLRGEKVYVITEAVGDNGHRAATTLMLASDY